MKSLRKNQKEMLEMKTTIKEMKNAFHRFIGRTKMAKQRIRELEDR
jgi:hypothetical protein